MPGALSAVSADGSEIQTSAPPDEESTRPTPPPCAAATSSTIERPSPDPPPLRAASARLKRSKARSRNLAESQRRCREREAGRDRPSLGGELDRAVAVLSALSTRLRGPDPRGADRRRRGGGSPRREAPVPTRRHGSRSAAQHRPGALGRADSRRIGSGPWSARAMRRRSSASRERRWVSSAAERSAILSSSWERGRRSARSSSVRRSARGVRSSWLASATKRRSCSTAACEAGEHVVQRDGEPGDLVSRGRQRQLAASPGVTASARRRSVSTGRSAPAASA